MVNIPFGDSDYFRERDSRGGEGIPFDDADFFLGRDARDAGQAVVSLNTPRESVVADPLEEASLLALGVGVSTIQATPPRTARGSIIPVTGISGLSAPVDAYLSEEHTSKLDMTKSPVESGGQSVTHAVRQPSKVRLTGRIIGPNSAAAWQEIKAMQSTMRLVTVYTSLGAYRNMLIAGAQSFIDSKSGYNLPFEIDLEELIIARRRAGGGGADDDETEDRGTVTATTVLGPDGPVVQAAREGTFLGRGGRGAVDRDVGLGSPRHGFYIDPVTGAPSHYKDTAAADAEFGVGHTFTPVTSEFYDDFESNRANYDPDVSTTIQTTHPEEFDIYRLRGERANQYEYRWSNATGGYFLVEKSPPGGLTGALDATAEFIQDLGGLF